MTEPDDGHYASFQAIGPEGQVAEGIVDTDTGEAVVMGEHVTETTQEFLAILAKAAADFRERTRDDDD